MFYILWVEWELMGVYIDSCFEFEWGVQVDEGVLYEEPVEAYAAASELCAEESSAVCDE
jgi:hypothetical protein